MQDLKIESEVYDQMLALAGRESPVEACGVLGGTDGLISVFIPMTNADNAHDHYSLVPEEQFAAVKKLRAEKKKILGIWHSHPASPARMSDEDLRLAYDESIAYLILSLQDGSAPVLKGFHVVDGKPQEVRLRIGDHHDQ